MWAAGASTNTPIEQTATFILMKCGGESISPSSPSSPISIVLHPEVESTSVIMDASQVDTLFTYTPSQGMTLLDCPAAGLQIFSDNGVTQFAPGNSLNVEMAPKFTTYSGRMDLYQGQIQLDPMGIRFNQIALATITAQDVYVKMLKTDGTGPIQRVQVTVCGSK